jgi:hypothetical protein
MEGKIFLSDYFTQTFTLLNFHEHYRLCRDFELYFLSALHQFLPRTQIAINMMMTLLY